jgi:hypothetical protein
MGRWVGELPAVPGGGVAAVAEALGAVWAGGVAAGGSGVDEWEWWGLEDAAGGGVEFLDVFA